jgi:hypothetical protein
LAYTIITYHSKKGNERRERKGLSYSPNQPNPTKKPPDKIKHARKKKTQQPKVHKTMGISPSSPSHAYSQLYLPADTFRLCHAGSSCFCRGTHPHNRSKYVYVDRSSNHNSHNNNNGNSPSSYPYYGSNPGYASSPREVFRDPMDLLERGMVPPGWGMAGVRDWRKRDWEIMNQMLESYLAAGGNGGPGQRGLRGGGGGGEFPWAEMMFANGGGAGGGGMQGMQGYGGGAGPMGFQQQQQQQPSAWGPAMGPGPGFAPPGAWQQSNGYQNPGNYGNMNPWQGPPEYTTTNKREIPSPADDPRFTGMDEKLRILTDIMFGSEAERQEKQVQEQLFKRFQPMIPELAKLIALQQQQQQAGSAGAGAGVGAPVGIPGMGGGAGMNPFAAGPAGMMPPPGMGMGMGMGGPMMNPYAMGGGMGPMMGGGGGGGGDPGMMGGGGGGGDMGGGGPGRRRNTRGRRPVRDYDYDDEDEDDFGGLGSRGRAGRGRRRRGGRLGRDDDLFDDWGGDGEYVEPGGCGVI